MSALLTKKYINSFGWGLVEKIIRLVITFFTITYLASKLGVDDYGVFSYSQSLVGLFSVLSTFGIDYIIASEVSKKKNSLGKIITCAILLRFSGFILMLSFLVIFLYVSSASENVIMITIVLSFCSFFQISSVISSTVVTFGDSRNNFFPNISSLIIFSSLKVYSVYCGLDLVYVALIFVIEQLYLALAFVCVWAKADYANKRVEYSKTTMLHILKHSWPIALSSAAILLYSRVDQVMIGMYSNYSEVAVYSIAVRIAEVGGFLPMLVVSSAFPVLIKSTKDKCINIYSMKVVGFISLVNYSGIISCLAIYLLVDFVVVSFLGEEYAAVSQLIPVYLLGMIFGFLGFASTQWLILENKTKYRLYRTIIGLLLNVVLNVYLIPIYGLYGAAYASLISQVVSSYILNGFSKQTRSLFYAQTLSFLYPFIRNKQKMLSHVFSESDRG